MTQVPEGTIIPPGKVKETIEKTAGYIARNGQQFANRLLKEGNDKFSFLKPEDPFYNYYDFCIQDYKQKAAALLQQQQQESMLSSTTNVQGKNVAGITTSDALQDSAQQQQAQLPKPEPQKFLFEIPYVNAMDLETIKLTAMFYAVNHTSEYLDKFKKHLFKKNQSQFEFLKESHRLNPVFNKFVQQYKLVIDPPAVIVSKVNQVRKDSDVASDYKVTNDILSRAYLIAENNYKDKDDKLQEKQRLEKERLEYASIDWDDFKIVQTVEFTELDKFSELPLPLSKNDLIYRSLQQKRASSLLEEAPPDFDQEILSQTQRTSYAATVATTTASEIQGPPSSSALPNRPPQQQEQEQQRQSAARVTVPRKGMKIRSAGETRLKRAAPASLSQSSQYTDTYVPSRKSQSPSTSAPAPAGYVKSPITGELIPEDKFDMHMKIVLRDPRYEQEKQNYLNKNAGSNLTDAEVFENIKRLRGNNDVQKQQLQSSRDNNSNVANKRAKVVQWDGYKNSAKAAQELANKQLSKEEIEAIKKQRYEQENKIGPRF